jgi:hypothetical protein
MATLMDGASRAAGGGTEVERDAANALLAGAHGAAAGAEALAPERSGLSLGDLLQSARRFSGFFSYVTSRWSLACFAVVSIRQRVLWGS